MYIVHTASIVQSPRRGDPRARYGTVSTQRLRIASPIDVRLVTEPGAGDRVCELQPRSNCGEVSPSHRSILVPPRTNHEVEILQGKNIGDMFLGLGTDELGRDSGG